MRRFFMLMLTTGLLMASALVQAAPVLYKGEMTVRKVSGNMCRLDSVGKVRKIELAVEHGADGLITGYFSGTDMATGRFEGSNTALLSVRYPFYEKEFAEGHSLTLSIIGDRATGQLREKHLEATAENCNFDEAEMTLAADSEDATQWTERTKASYEASALITEGQYWQKKAWYADAEPLYKRSLAIREKVLGPEHPDVAGSLNNLAWLYQTTGRYADAEPLYKRSLAIFEKVLGPEHPDVATSLNELADQLELATTSFNLAMVYTQHGYKLSIYTQ